MKEDKQLHLITGIYIGIISISAFLLVGLQIDSYRAFIYATCVGLGAGIVKELIDYKSKKGTVEKLDALYTGLGSMIGSLITLTVLTL